MRLSTVASTTWRPWASKVVATPRSEGGLDLEHALDELGRGG
jgi:hypothetical protein